MQVTNENKQEATSLTALSTGQQGVIAWVDAEHPFAHRLRDLGFVKGSQVMVRQKAPFQDPVEYEVRGSRFCLRHREASSIHVVSSSVSTP
jgi:ferrous iron transport protein A